MNCWRSRLLVLLILWITMDIHAAVLERVPNSPAGMLAFHGSAAAVDWILFYCLPWLLHGELCADMEATCIASMVGNAVGYFAYLAYVPPVFFNTYMWGLCCVQAIRLLLLDRNDLDHLRFSLVRGPYCDRHQTVF